MQKQRFFLTDLTLRHLPDVLDGVRDIKVLDKVKAEYVFVHEYDAPIINCTISMIDKGLFSRKTHGLFSGRD